MLTPSDGGSGQGNGAAHIAAVAVAVPPLAMGQADAGAFLARHYAAAISPRALAILNKVCAHPSIRRRHFALASPEEILGEDPDARVARFTRAAVELSAQAARRALERAGLGVAEVAAVVVNTCTGYLCPGLSTYLLEELGLARETRVYDLVGAGCGGAVPNLELSRDILAASAGRAVLSVSVEICSATFQMGDDLSLIVSNALFADGAAACVLSGHPQGMRIVAIRRLYAPESRDAIRYVHKGGQLHNQLSPALPRLVGGAVRQVVGGLLAAHGLSVAEVPHWAIHPGGEKVLNAIQEGLALSDEQVRVSREVLAAYGNMSSPTVWFELERLLANGMVAGDWCVVVGAGAGLSAHAALLRAD